VLAVVLFEPEIPPNTGNVIRLCANTGCELHLIQPLGFDWDDRQLRRAGLDYHEFTPVQRHESLGACRQALGARRWFAMSTRGSRQIGADAPAFADGDVFLFGPESRGLPAEVLDGFPPESRLRLPMRPGQRSLNLSNAVAVTVFEAWRQMGYVGAK
jgi:tRNA (cytidine/uridine-2'-O-)-methyltransferase